MTPKFSILHPTARPDECRKIIDAWKAAAAHPEQVEYILSVDPRWGFEDLEYESNDEGFGRFVQVVNRGRRCYVDSVNTAAKAATGDVLIVVADDQYPCDGWDVALDSLSFSYETAKGYVVEVSTGTVKEHERGILVMPILSRARYECLGYVFYPAYESMFADGDFCEHARMDGVVVDARYLMFPHRHPLIEIEKKYLGQQVSQEVWDKHVSKEAWDEHYKAQHRPEAYELGKRVLAMRRASRFGDIGKPVAKRTMALCLSGDSFHSAFLLNVLGLQQWLIEKGWAVFVHHASSSLAYFTRHALLESVLAQKPEPELVLWMDHDNILSVPMLERLIQNLDQYPEAASVAGWYWLDNKDGGFRTSVGIKGVDGQTEYMPIEMVKESSGLIEVSWHGFGAVLMRRETLATAGEFPFASIPAPNSRYGMTGEDVSFCIHALERAGSRFFVDPAIFVPHLKIGTIGPAGLSKTQAEPVIVACIRAKNEAQNIARCIQSLAPICKTILVLDDHSTDDTPMIADDLGATVYPSRFTNRDEGRDRQFLLGKAREAKADWILTIDADEAIDPRDVATLMHACRFGSVDAFYLKWMHFRDSGNQVRVDGVYGMSSPLRLFRVKPGLSFTSISNGIHMQVPEEITRAVLNVRLWHWGYMNREDRIRKWRYYNEVDPNNFAEDCYRHLVQGDIPEVPAEAKLGKAGPLHVQMVEPPPFEFATPACGPEREKEL